MQKFLPIVVAVVCGAASPAAAAIIGTWDFSGGSLAAVAGSIALSELRTKPYYSAYGGRPGIPAIEFGSTAEYGIAAPGAGAQVVLRVPSTAGYGPMGGLIAEFPRLTNATSMSLNRYTIVMDVLVRQSAYDAVQLRPAGSYVSLFQTVASSDGELFVDVRQPNGPAASRPLGVGGVYGGDVVADQWHRLAWVASLDAAHNQPRFQAFVNGQLASSLVWDTLQAEGLATNDTIKLDLTDPTAPPGSGLKPDGRFSIFTLGQITSQNPANTTGPSAFFLFNDNNDELGETFVANLQFRDQALGAGEILALGGASGGIIPVPEPAGVVLAVGAAVAWAAGRYGAPSLRAARARCTSGSMA